MANVLSQEEVDSLLGGIGEGKVETETGVPEIDGVVQAYDFSKKSLPVHLRLPALGMINERFINLVNDSLSTSVGSVIDVSVSEIDSVKFGDFCRSLPVPASLNIFKMEPLRGFALLVFEGWLVFAFVDAIFGGKCARHVKLEGKSFTAIEGKIISKIVNIVLGDLQKAWSDAHEVQMSWVRSAVDSQFVGIAKPNDMIVATKFNVNIGSFTGGMTICVPYVMIEPIRKKLRDNYQGEKVEIDQTWRRHIESKIQELTINLKCTLGTLKLTGRELLEMKTDDVFMMDQKTDDPVVVSIGNLTKFRGYLGSTNNKKAVKISERINME
jgi:flagellar motor switch protein FliM